METQRSQVNNLIRRFSEVDEDPDGDLPDEDDDQEDEELQNKI
jgi:hypothetical protein